MMNCVVNTTVFVVLLLFVTVANAWIIPTSRPSLSFHATSTSKVSSQQALYFHPSNNNVDNEDSTTITSSTNRLPYKVTKTILARSPRIITEEKHHSHKSFLGTVQEKAVDFLLFTYELDRKEFTNKEGDLMP